MVRYPTLLYFSFGCVVEEMDGNGLQEQEESDQHSNSGGKCVPDTSVLTGFFTRYLRRVPCKIRALYSARTRI
jgi:hypothetical protein